MEGSTQRPRRTASVGAARGPRPDSRAPRPGRNGKRGAVHRHRGSLPPALSATLSPRPDSVVNSCLGRRGSGGPGASDRSGAGRAGGRPRGWASTGPRPLPPPRLNPSPGPDPTREGKEMLCFRPRASCEGPASLRARAPHLPRSRRSPSCRSRRESGEAGAAEEAGAMRGGQGRFSLYLFEAASLSAPQAVLPVRLGWAAARAAAPQRVEGGGCFYQRDACSTQGGAMFLYGETSDFRSPAGRRGSAPVGAIFPHGKAGRLPAKGFQWAVLMARGSRSTQGGAMFPYGKAEARPGARRGGAWRGD